MNVMPMVHLLWLPLFCYQLRDVSNRFPLESAAVSVDHFSECVAILSPVSELHSFLVSLFLLKSALYLPRSLSSQF